jgi:hypothetical protein
MSFLNRASKRTFFTLASNRTISSEPITVHGFKLANGSNTDALIEFTDINDSTMFYVAVKAHETEPDHQLFIADNGLKVKGLDKNIHLTVFHNHAGT